MPFAKVFKSDAETSRNAAREFSLDNVLVINIGFYRRWEKDALLERRARSDGKNCSI